MVFDFEELRPYLESDSITDVNYNGKDLWLDDLEEGRIVVRDFWNYESMQKLIMKFANHVNMLINEYTPVLEADYLNYRVAALHQSVSGRLSVSIRKTSYTLRILEDEIESSQFMSKSALKFLKYVVGCRCNVIVSGLPGSGKTEMIKFLTQYIPEHERVITIEDTSELHYDHLYPDRDCVGIKINQQLNYSQAIKTSLRQRADWIILSEARGEEVVDLLTSISTGTHLLSSIHAKNAHEIPMRMIHMMPHSDLSSVALKHRVYDMLDVGIHMEMRIQEKGIHRYVHEIVVFQKEDALSMYHSSQKRLLEKVPPEIKERASLYGIRW